MYVQPPLFSLDTGQTAPAEVTPLLGGQPRFDHADLQSPLPAHTVQDHPEIKYSQLPSGAVSGHSAASLQAAPSQTIPTMDAGQWSQCNHRPEGSESPSASPPPVLTRRQTEYIWKA